ncbi:MAG: DUF1566 domain-containing protein [Spirochaetes bacterium]|nr:MAG: DUF1566 domain-containing protein [Spirochaetota bacterium]
MRNRFRRLAITMIAAALAFTACGGSGDGSSGGSDAECVAEDKADLAITYAGGDSAASVTQHIAFALTGASGTTISWLSDTTAVIANNGTVTRPSYTNGDEEVIVTATIAKGNARDTKVFTLTVIKAPATEAECVAEDKANLSITYAGNDSASSVIRNITVPGTGASGTTIGWLSNNTAVVANNGTVTRPSFESSDAEVILTATITRGSAHDTKTFILTVKKLSNVKLASIVVSKGRLQPVFDASVTDYLDAPVPFSDNTNPAYDDLQSAGIKATVADANAVMTINGTVVPSGDEYEMNNLKVGKNNAVITITVPGDIITETYTIEVYRAIPVFKTGQTSTDAGISWPSPRFTDNGDGTVMDKMTGLMWIKNANAIKTLYPDFDHQPDTGWGDGKVTWAKALEFIGKINDGTYNCGATTAYTDWRMPNVREMRTLLLYIQDFSSITAVYTNAATLRDDWYFTSTTDPTNTGHTMITNFYQSSIYIGKKVDPNSTLNYVWPVRSAP